MPDKVMEIIERVEWVDMRATFGGRWDAFRVAGKANSAVGDLRADVNLSRRRDGAYPINGVAEVMGRNLGSLINVPMV